ncbi:MAG: hypothetical protein ACRD0J_02685 [Acidimicrobiales bacterium]
MGTFVGFAVGYLAGTAAGREGRAEAMKALRAILASEEAGELMAAARAIGTEMAGRLGGAALSEIKGALGHRTGREESGPRLVAA